MWLSKFSLSVVAMLSLVCVGCTMSWPGVGSDTGFAYQNFPVAKTTASTGEGDTVTFKGAPLVLEGHGVNVGDTLPNVQVAKNDLSLMNIADTKGTVRVISIVPSLDTKVCEQQTHYLSKKNNGLDTHVQLITISVDTPFAQGRFAKDAKINNVTFLSDYRGGDFGKTNGLLVTGPHILARSLMVVDKDNVIRYLQVTPELAQLPDLEAAFQAANALVQQKG